MLLPGNEKIAPVVKLELQNFDNFWFEKYFLRIEQTEGAGLGVVSISDSENELQHFSVHWRKCASRICSFLP